MSYENSPPKSGVEHVPNDDHHEKEQVPGLEMERKKYMEARKSRA